MDISRGSEILVMNYYGVCYLCWQIWVVCSTSRKWNARVQKILLKKTESTCNNKGIERIMKPVKYNWWKLYKLGIWCMVSIFYENTNFTLNNKLVFPTWLLCSLYYNDNTTKNHKKWFRNLFLFHNSGIDYKPYTSTQEV